MNRRTKKKLKAQINTLKAELFEAQLSVRMNNIFSIRTDPVTFKVTVPMYRALYPEQAYPELRYLIMCQLEKEIDNFIDTYRDDITANYVAYFKFIPTFRKR